MRTTTSSPLVLFIALLVAAPVSILAATPEPAVLRVQVQTRAGLLEGTGVLVHQDSRGSETAFKATTGGLEIPFEFEPRDMRIDATATVTEPQSLHLADVTVLILHDRTVKVRFTMTGVRPPPFAAICPPGQALVSVRLDFLALPRRY